MSDGMIAAQRLRVNASGEGSHKRVGGGYDDGGILRVESARGGKKYKASGGCLSIVFAQSRS